MIQEKTGIERRSFTAMLTICCLITFGCYFAVSMRLPVVPLYARGFGITTAQIGVINAAFYLMAGLLSLPSGILSDLLGRKQLAAIGSIILFAGMLLLYFGRSYIQLAGLYLFLGVGTAAFGPTMMSLVAEITPSTHMGRAYGWYTTALFCGLGMGPAAGGAMGKWFGLRPVFLIATGLVALTIWVLSAVSAGVRAECRCEEEGRSVAGGIQKHLYQLAAHRLLGIGFRRLRHGRDVFFFHAPLCRRPGFGCGADRYRFSGSLGDQRAVTHPFRRLQRSCGAA